ncbi:MAG: DUF5686 and carboxypeptidase regulatory-like domain-containing protein [Microscillaceae bacterium]|nr:DUF5686 and carboxypeptidase regulatory-like domain-containing protein [Microscillaceae bacterium]
MKKTLKTAFLAILFVLTSLFTQAAIIKGRITDTHGNALAFANLIVKNTTIGTTSNEDGYYSLDLAPGKYELIFQYIGFRKKSVEVDLSYEDILIDVVLESESFLLKEIVIEGSDYDPAYAIIRKAQEKRRYYLREEIKSYRCKAYIKGLQKLTKKPRSLVGVKIDLDTGIVYFSESISELSFENPDKYKEKMISSKVSGNNQAFSFNQATDTWVNLYENVNGEELNGRGLVSPIAANALAYYRYRLEGAYQEGNSIINKIRIIPRRKNAPAYSGFIYIIEDSWRIHSADLYLTKGTLEFVDSAAIQQVYAPVPEKGLWLPVSQKVSFDFKAFGFEGNGYFIFVYSNYEVEPMLQPKYFDNEVIAVEPEANKRDTSYWNKIRPVPLTFEEMKDYREKDSIRIIKESPVYRDSVDAVRNKISIGEILWAGYTYEKSHKKVRLSFQPILSTFQYNTVEGFVTDFNINYQKSYEDRRSFSIAPVLRYGFSNRAFQGKITAGYTFNAYKRARFEVEGGHYVDQFSRTNSISPFVNTFYTLLREENFLKIYQKSYGKFFYGQELINGLRFFGTMEYAHRQALANTSDYTFKDFKEREFTPNFPINQELAFTDFAPNQSLTLGFVFLINFKQKYASYPNLKFVVESKYPTLRINYRRGLRIFGSDVDYDFLTLGINHSFTLGLVGESNYEIEAGAFLSKKSLTFVDFRHFNGNQTIFLNTDFSSFQLLDYYQYSTQDRYIRAHFTHHFNGLLINAIPLIKKLKWQGVLGVNYLHTEQAGNYLELNVGIEHIFKILRIDFVNAFQTGQSYRNGFRIGLGF